MSGPFDEVRLFFREFRTTYHSTGAVLPSGRSLSVALTHFVRDEAAPIGTARRILEVGPGTGAVTREIIRTMKAGDRLDLVELNERFVEHLTDKLATDNRYSIARDRVRVLHAPVQEVSSDPPYNVVISCLPLNNFAPDVVREIVDKLRALVSPGGTLSFFEYVAIRRAKAAVSNRAERLRLAEIGTILGDLLQDYEVRRDRVWKNVPPAWAHHLRFS